MSTGYQYDMVVIGSGPGGHRAAIQAAKLGKRVAVVEANSLLGGVCLHDGTIPSKSIREAILHLSGYRERSHYGKAYRVKQRITMDDLSRRLKGIVTEIEQDVRSQLIRNNINFYEGFGSLIDAHQVGILKDGRQEHLTTENIVIATGTRPRHPPGIQVDHETILDSNSILHMKKMPKTLTVVGGGVIGSEYGSMFAALDVKVTIVEAQDRILGFVDKEIVETLVANLRSQKATLITNDKVIKCAVSPDGRAVTYLESGKRIVSEKLLISAGRIPNSDKLNLEGVGIKISDRGNILVNNHFQTSCPNVYAVGDVIGHPALASTSIEQGRRAACHAFGLPDLASDVPLPFGIFTVPEIGMVGKTEQELSASKLPYEVGIARLSEVEKGKIVGDTFGVLKILFHRGTLQVLGVHVIGHEATELVHLGQLVMAFQGSIQFLAHNVFNYPSLCQAYKTAALDGLNKVIATQDLPDEIPFTDLDLNLN